MTDTEPDTEPKAVREPTPFTEDEQGIFRVLVAEHRVVDGLLERLELGEDGGDRRGLVEDLTRELLAHAKAEERTVYAVLEEHGALAADIEESFDEHGDVEHLLLALDPDAGGDTFIEQVTRLRQSVRDHVRREEEDILQRAGNLLGLEESRAMARAFQDEKRAELADLGSVVATDQNPSTTARM
jgi:hemerythrin superfamily protein